MSATREYTGDAHAVINPCMFRDPKNPGVARHGALIDNFSHRLPEKTSEP
ncbi:MAG: hypothetical protein KAS74_01120 [Methanosarcinales archaeon]|nr:hypothetical protein [Methanosarcinales archaeon]